VKVLPRTLRLAWWAVGWFGVGLVIYLSLMHGPPELRVPEGDKIQHMAAYAVLTLWFAQLSANPRHRLATAMALIGLGVALEFVQRTTDYREFSYGDMLADALGVMLGGWLAPPRMPNLLLRAERLLVRGDAVADRGVGRHSGA
jgi:VanZ family protein